MATAVDRQLSAGRGPNGGKRGDPQVETNDALDFLIHEM